MFQRGWTTNQMMMMMMMMMMIIMMIMMMFMTIDDYDETSYFLCSLLKDRPCYFLRRMGALETHPGEASTTKASVAQLRNKVDRGMMQEQWNIIYKLWLIMIHDIQKNYLFGVALICFM